MTDRCRRLGHSRTCWRQHDMGRRQASQCTYLRHRNPLVNFGEQTGCFTGVGFNPFTSELLRIFISSSNFLGGGKHSDCRGRRGEQWNSHTRTEEWIYTYLYRCKQVIYWHVQVQTGVLVACIGKHRWVIELYGKTSLLSDLLAWKYMIYWPV